MSTDIVAVTTIINGGGVQPSDGVFQFKARFGREPRPLGGLRQIYDPAAYATLCTRAGVSPADTGGWFPAYRARVDS